jgi:hypothetical protein
LTRRGGVAADDCDLTFPRRSGFMMFRTSMMRTKALGPLDATLEQLQKVMGLVNDGSRRLDLRWRRHRVALIEFARCLQVAGVLRDLRWLTLIPYATTGSNLPDLNES